MIDFRIFERMRNSDHLPPRHDVGVDDPNLYRDIFIMIAIVVAAIIALAFIP